ncbi:EamA family transporter [Gordonibacter sp.]|uniref:EamA family transporter n=1 Tax=Gordonibacter sp. TaxID=1968902 RepID=UPI002FC877F4
MAAVATKEAAPRRNHVARGIVFAALGGICWGFSGTCAQLLTSELGAPVAWITCVRLLMGAAIFLVACLVKNWRSLRAVMRDKRSLLRIAAFSLFGVLLTQVSYLSSISFTNAGTGTVLERLGLIVIMLYVCLRARRRPSLREAVGLVMAIGGTFLIATKGNFGALAIPAEGLFWGIVSAFALACYTLIPGKALEKWGSFIVTGLAMLLGGTVATVFVQPWNIPVDVTPQLAGVMVAMVIIGTFLAYLFYLQGITDAGPVRAGLVGCVEPVSATVISAVWLGTPVLPVDILGMIMIMVMMVLVTQRGEASKQPADAYEGSTDDLPPFEGRASLLGYYRARPAMHDDFVRFQEILADGHEALAAAGVDEKGSKTYPSERRVMRAIDRKTAYVVTLAGRDDGAAQDADERIIGVFALDPNGDEVYAHAMGASWLSTSPEPPEHTTYAALHWVTVAAEARRRGVGMFILGEADRLAKAAEKVSVRCDAYEGNDAMRALLVSFGFTPCGGITLFDRFGRARRRTAFERMW